MAGGDGQRRAFVVWDSSAHGVKTNLELLRRNPPAGFDVEVLGLDRKGAGAIWTSNVEPAIRAAEIALALIDLPNANVGFEIGFALGLAGSGRDNVKTKRVRLVAAGGQVPPWLDRPPFQHQLVAPASKKSELAALITDEGSMDIPARPTPGGGTLILCPRDGTGEGIHDDVLAVQRPHWSRPKTDGWEIRDLPQVLDGIGRVVWVILAYSGDEQRDGAENAAAAAIAGYALAHGIELHAWQQTEARDVVDVGKHRRKWTSIDDLERLIRELEDQGAPGPPPDLSDVHRNCLRIIHRDLVPFFAHVERPLGDMFVDLLLDLQPDGRGDGDDGALMPKLALRELPRGLATTPTLKELLDAKNDGLAGRYVVLGEPGAGKSTLCRHLCFELAGRAGADAPIPVFVSLARLARDLAHDAFDLAEQDAAFHFGEQAAAGLSQHLRDLAAQGRVWLFLDGLDEVPGDARAPVRARIEAFAADTRIARVVVTSREVGYERLGASFVHARVRPLSQDGGRRLLDCWLHDRAADAWRRIQESPRVSDLARNPLLLTLLAVIALEDEKLPPTRVKLYARAVRMLLKRGQGREVGGVKDEFAAEAILAALSLKLHETGEDAWSEEHVNRVLRELRAANASVRERSRRVPAVAEGVPRGGRDEVRPARRVPWTGRALAVHAPVAARVSCGEGVVGGAGSGAAALPAEEVEADQT